jgi:cytochrome P450
MATDSIEMGPQTMQHAGACPHMGIGQEFQPFSAAHLSNPYAFYARARREEPVFFSPMLNMWVITRYDDVVAVLKDTQRFSSEQLLWVGGSTFTPEVQELLSTGILGKSTPIIYADPPKHPRMRAPLTRAFSARRVASMEPAIRQLATQLIERWIHSGQADFVAGFAKVYPMHVILRMLGVPEKDYEQIREWGDGFTQLLFARLTPEQQLEYARGYLAWQQHTYQLIEQRRAEPQDDLTSALLKAVEEEQANLSTVELVELVINLSFAGLETTANFLGLCLYHLLTTQRPYWEAIRENPALIPALVEEGLRFDTPGQSLLRVTTQEVELSGVTIPQGAIVLILESSANHDEQYFAHPQEFDPYRENLNRHIAFGRGIHFCIGAPLARLETQIALEVLSQRLPNARLVPDQEPGYIPNLALRGFQQLLITWD